ncbi:MAG: hypothetical protein M3P98_04390 [bacterium]|nr:hypothetical protein [bacterium]
MIIRQGDILFKQNTDVVAGKDLKQLTIAEGEVTGHHHILVAETDSVIVGDRTKFSVKGKAKLIHPEHGTIIFPAGNYVVLQECEFDYVENTLIQVKD